MKELKINSIAKICIAYILSLSPSYATVSVNDNLTGASSSYEWQALNGACLTAGNNTGSIPACHGLAYYSGKDLVGGNTGTLPDTVGNGALRLSNGARDSGTNGNDQTGALYSKFAFPSNSGVDITFKTVTYAGNGYENHAGVASGADGIAFFLTDADQVPTVDNNTKIGAFGGSLGYSCANGKVTNDGLYAAYIGLGIDEFGNYSNKSDNTSTGAGEGWNRVTLRGAGTVNWKWLSENKSNYYPSSVLNTPILQQNAVKRVCANGKLYDYSSNHAGVEVPRTGNNYDYFYNYPYIAHTDIMAGSNGSSDTINERKKRRPLFNQQKTANPLRSAAIPISYNIKITQDGILGLSYSYNGGETINIVNNQDITRSNGPLPRNFRFGFSSGTGGGSNVHEIMCFKADQMTSSATSAAGNVPTLGRIVSGSQLYVAAYHTKNWWGQLTSQNLVEDPDTGIVTINNKATWDASCKLTGGICDSTGENTSAQSTRKLFTWNNTGVTLNWNNLSTTQKDALSNEQKILNWLKGSRVDERNNIGVGDLRKRDSLLGDVINSSPTWNGPPQAPYKDNWRNLINSVTFPENGTSAEKYSEFISAKKLRTHAVYVGANDGFLHAFRSGHNSADGTYQSSNNDGAELFAYMPDQVLRTIANPSNENLSLPNTLYGHNAFVDATPGIGDVFYNNSWHTILVSGLGLGGNLSGVIANDTNISKGSIFALDITDPDSFDSSKIIGEWNSDNLTCTNNTNCKDSLGSTVGTPVIRRLHDGNWAAIFPNGQNSKSGEAGIYIMKIDQASGEKTFRYIKADEPLKNSGSITKRNGISQITAADLDGDSITDYVYAGDMFGNLWRFDLTSTTPDNWSVRTTPIYKSPQPITTAVTVTANSNNGIYRLMLSFGTGRIFPQTLNSMTGSAPGNHYLYGLWDSDMDSWNYKSTVRYASLTLNSSDLKITDSEILNRTITNHSYTNNSLGINGARSISSENLCWKSSATCTSNNNKRGWRILLPGQNEQIFYNPVIQDGFLIINTTVPAYSAPLSCDISAASGFTMAIPPETGTPKKSYFLQLDSSLPIIAGLGTSGVGSIMTVRSGSRAWGITQTHGSKPKIMEIDPSANSTYKRLNWIQRK